MKTTSRTPAATIRAPRMEDAENVARLLRACDVVIFGEPDTDVADVRDDWSQPGFDLARDAWVVEGSDGFRAYAYLRTRAEGSDYDGDIRVLPGASIEALTPPLLERVEARVRERVNRKVSLCFFTSSVEREMREVLEAAGYREIRTFFRMRIDLTPMTRGSDGFSPILKGKGSEPGGEPSLPLGVEIRPIRLGEDDRAIHSVIEDSFADHFRHRAKSFEAWWAGRSRHERFDPSLLLLAWEGDEVAGGLTGYDYGDIGFVRELGVRSRWRGKGIGSALLLRSFEAFRARGQLKVALGVDAENESAIGLYQRVGMRVDSRHPLLERVIAP